MNGAQAEPPAWSTRKLWLAVAAAVVVQTGLILWFSAQSPRPARAVDARPAVQFLPLARGELLAVTDPTLFSRAHPNGFSGPAWLGVPTPPEPGQHPESVATPMWLAIAPESLGGTLSAFVKTHNTGSSILQNWPSPAVTQPSSPPILTMVTGSVVQVEGALSARGLVEALPLPSWAHSDLLAPSEVQVMVDARGNPISALLLAGSGLKAADQAAVALAQSARFGSDPAALNTQSSNPVAGLVFGRLVFRWHTLPAAAPTNSSPNLR